MRKVFVDMNQTERKNGKRCADTPKKTRKYLAVAVVLCIVAVLVGTVFISHIIKYSMQEDSVFQKIVRDGYTGTQEQWLASLVGEEVRDESAKTAYELACEYGYRASKQVWLETLTHHTPEDMQKTPYTIACENGYSGTLVQWLTTLAEDPDMLGRSNSAEGKTDYELACEYGYAGTFIEWLVSVTHDRVF